MAHGEAWHEGEGLDLAPGNVHSDFGCNQIERVHREHKSTGSSKVVGSLAPTRYAKVQD
jgi:hypothetical protein